MNRKNSRKSPLKITDATGLKAFLSPIGTKIRKKRNEGVRMRKVHLRAQIKQSFLWSTVIF